MATWSFICGAAGDLKPDLLFLHMERKNRKSFKMYTDTVGLPKFSLLGESPQRV